MLNQIQAHKANKSYIISKCNIDYNSQSKGASLQGLVQKKNQNIDKNQNLIKKLSRIKGIESMCEKTLQFAKNIMTFNKCTHNNKG